MTPDKDASILAEDLFFALDKAEQISDVQIGLIKQALISFASKHSEDLRKELAEVKSDLDDSDKSHKNYCVPKVESLQAQNELLRAQAGPEHDSIALHDRNKIKELQASNEGMREALESCLNRLNNRIPLERFLGDNEMKLEIKEALKTREAK